MEPSVLLEKLRDILAADEKLQSWCQEKLGGKPTVYLGMNPEMQPPTEDYPVIVIFGADRQQGEDARYRRFACEIGVALTDDSIEVDEDKKTKTYTGMLLVEQFRETLEGAIFRARLGKVSADGETALAVYFPIFESHTLITFDFVRSSRGPLG